MHKMSIVDRQLHGSHAYISWATDHSGRMTVHTNPTTQYYWCFTESGTQTFQKARQLPRVTELGRTEIEIPPKYNSRAALFLFNTASYWEWIAEQINTREGSQPLNCTAPPSDVAPTLTTGGRSGTLQIEIGSSLHGHYHLDVSSQLQSHPELTLSFPQPSRVTLPEAIHTRASKGLSLGHACQVFPVIIPPASSWIPCEQDYSPMPGTLESPTVFR